MKLASKMFTLTALVVACSAASAQQTASVAVTGNITPPACTASMSNGGAFAYADIDATTLNDASTTNLPTSPKATFNISCVGAAQVSWAITDNRSDSSYLTSDTGYFGLGKDSDGHKIGSYFVRMNSEFLDGVTAWAMKSGDAGKTWAYLQRDNYVMRPAQLYTYSNDGYVLTKGKEFTADMYVWPTIAPKSGLSTSSEIDLDGSVTINLGYL